MGQFRTCGSNICLRYALEALKKRPKTIPTTTILYGHFRKNHSKLRTYNKTDDQESSDNYKKPPAGTACRAEHIDSRRKSEAEENKSRKRLFQQLNVRAFLPAIQSCLL